MNKDTIYLYYGTQNLDLDNKYNIDPDYNGNKIFEFGNGFYLTPNKSLAKAYAKHDFLEKGAKPENRQSLDNIMDGVTFKGNLHIYELDYKKLSEQTIIKEFEGSKEYETILRQTMDGYKKDKNYRPNRDITFGEICGQFWDEYWNNKSPLRTKLSEDQLIKKCIMEMERNKNNKQICIHKKNIGIYRKNVFEEYLMKIRVEVI